MGRIMTFASRSYCWNANADEGTQHRSSRRHIDNQIRQGSAARGGDQCPASLRAEEATGGDDGPGRSCGGSIWGMMGILINPASDDTESGKGGGLHR